MTKEEDKLLDLDNDFYLFDMKTELEKLFGESGSGRSGRETSGLEAEEVEVPEWVREVTGQGDLTDLDTDLKTGDLSDPGVDTETLDALSGLGLTSINPDLLPSWVEGGPTWRTSFEGPSDDPEKYLLNNDAFEAVVDAIDTEYWNASPMNRFQINPRDIWGSGTSEAYGDLGSFDSQELPTRMHSYRGESGELTVQEFGNLITNTETEYDPSEDAYPVSEMAHGALMHAAGVLMRYDAETEGEGIRVENLSSGEAEEVVQAYTVVDSLLQSEDWDQRTIMEQIMEDKDPINSYSVDFEGYTPKR